MASLPNKSKFKGRGQDYLDWMKLGYVDENVIYIEPEMEVLPSNPNCSQFVEAIPSYKKSHDKTYSKKYISEHLQEFQNTTSRPSTISTSKLEELDDISTIADTDLDTNYEDTEAEKAQVYLHYDFSKYDELSLKLPVNNWRKEILQKIDAYPVIVIQGETGCGKSTQVPQFILDNAVNAIQHVNIVVTQPRKIAAISLASRVCDERGWMLGKLVGYKVGLNNETDVDTRISYVTTEVLVQKIIRKRSLNEFTHIILDEVHERDQHADFAMLVVKKLLHTVSKNVKIILMSATIDSDKFANYFATPVNGLLIPAPVINVADKTVHKVQIFYLGTLKLACPDKKIPVYSQKEPGISHGMYLLALKIVKIFDDIERQEYDVAHPKFPSNRGAVLIFVPGLFEIEAMINLLRQDTKEYWWDCYPLHSTLTIDEQRRAFDKKNAKYRKIIVSTNIAESSITVPDVKYVIDFCLTKVLHCDPVTNYTCLRIAWASKASCRQRAGRAGRVSSGRVYRLVEEEFYQDLESYITPELCRTPLSQVVLKTKLLDMGPPESLLALALDPPNLSEIYRTVLVLKQIGALGLKTDGRVSSIDGTMTYLGRVAARLPLDPHLSKLIVLGHIFGCLTDTIIIAASLSLKSLHATPFQDELNAFFSKVSWAYSMSSDCFASLHVYKAWESHVSRGEFLPTNSGKERKWAHSSYVQIETLKDVHKLVLELTDRLKTLKIKPIGAERSSMDDQYILLALKMCIAGAFFPNYFKRNIPENYETVICKELSSHDPYRTVIITGLPPDSNILYEKQIKDMFRVCSDEIKIYYEDRKAYIEFPKKNRIHEENYEIPGKFPTSVHMAIKIRHVRRMKDTLVLKLHSPSETQKLLSNIVIEGNNPSNLSEKVQFATVLEKTRKRTVQSNQKELKPPDMPLPSRSKDLWNISVTHVENPNQIWVTSDENDCIKNIIYLQSTIEFAIKKSKPLSQNQLIPQMLCLAPFEDGDGMEIFYRARIEKVFEKGSNKDALVWYVDFGNYQTVSTLKLRNLTEELFEIPMLAIECSLCEIKPASNLCSESQWQDDCKTWLIDKLKYNKFKAQIYSVVHNVVHLTLLDNEGSEKAINEQLIHMGYAVRASESLLSKQNHMLRELYCPEVETSRSQNTWSSESSTFSLNDDGRSKSNQLRIQCLHGPSSPLEMKFICISRSGSPKGVILDRNSVNSTALDTEPTLVWDRMIVSCFVVLNPSGNTITLRSTTMMPFIPGMLPLCLLLFSPAAELRTNESKTAYTGAVFGLGFDPSTNSAIYPDDDIEVNFDFNFSSDDLRQVNQIRYLMSSALDELEDMPDKSLLKVQKCLREYMYRLLSVKRHYVEPIYFPLPYRWNQVTEDDILHPVTQTGMEENENIVFPLHAGVDLKIASSNQIMLEKALKLQRLESKLRAEKYSLNGEIEENCPICSVKIKSLSDLQIHLQNKKHTQWMDNALLHSDGS